MSSSISKPVSFCRMSLNLRMPFADSTVARLASGYSAIWRSWTWSTQYADIPKSSSMISLDFGLVSQR